MTIRIVVDEREKNSKVPNLLKIMGVFVDYEQLTVGDYIVSSETVIERKTIHDLINSIYDGRLFIQCSDLVNHYSKPFIILEGNITDLDTRERSDLNSKLIVDKIRIAYDTLIKIALDFRIPILYTPSIYYTAELLIHLASNLLKDKNEGPLLKKIKKSNPFYIQQLYVLTSLPGIGTKLATRLLDKFHSPKNVLNASIAELARVPGLGNMRAEKIRRILDTTTVCNDLVNNSQTRLIVNTNDNDDIASNN
ncbi:MAG: helix-hairpin-helix domain-containing protein [Thermoproteota archaeon]|nr:helix-hairpin-helix domain-containing protein [Thermoproteota archaeon]